jgi:DNA-binding NtrC family response regulator
MVTLAEQDFDVVLVDLATCTSALRLVTLLKDGAGEFLRVGFTGKRWRESGEFGELVRLMHRELQELHRLGRPRVDADVEPEATLQYLIGRSAPMREVFSKIRRMRAESCNVLVVGEPGTGKKAIAEAIHEESLLSTMSLRLVSCRPDLTALQLRPMLQAIGEALPSTLVVEHVDRLNLAAQRTLMECISEPRMRSLRLIATTTRNLDALERDGEFLKSLLVALNTAKIELPPLRDRRDDIVPIAQQVLDDPEVVEQHGRLELKPATIEQLIGYHWPGNVAELVGMMQEWASLLASGSELKLPQEASEEDLPTSELEDVLFRAFHAHQRGWKLPREVLEKAKMRHALTPFVVISPDSSFEYAVIITAPNLAFVKDPRKMPVVNTVMTVEIAPYLGTAKPMA